VIKGVNSPLVMQPTNETNLRSIALNKGQVKCHMKHSERQYTYVRIRNTSSLSLFPCRPEELGEGGDKVKKGKVVPVLN
jgi:hypothetical protein